MNNEKYEKRLDNKRKKYILFYELYVYLKNMLKLS